MGQFLFQYQPVHPTTWVYLSSLLLVALYFKFNRLWSVRNLDLVLLVLFSPGLLLFHHGREIRLEVRERNRQWREAAEARVTLAAGEVAPANAAPPAEGAAAGTRDAAPAAGFTASDQELHELNARRDQGRSLEAFGFIWLLALCGLWSVRMLIDPSMVRRPLLEPNLTTGGLFFLGCSLFVFLMANVLASPRDSVDVQGSRDAVTILADGGRTEPTSFELRGPGHVVLYALPAFSTMRLRERPAPTDEESGWIEAEVVVAKTMIVLAHLALAVGIVLIGHYHFENVKMGVGVATLYFLLPYSALLAGQNHSVIGALVVWAVFFYRRPLTAGVFLGLAMGTSYYALYLLPLWLSFYWERGLMRFLIGVLSTLAVLVLFLAVQASDLAQFWMYVRAMFGLWLPVTTGLRGVWEQAWPPFYRIPIITAFVALSISMTLWPAQKNLGTLLSCSAAILLAAQFWHRDGGGLYMAWFLPLLLLTMFRPNLEDRVALTVLSEGWRKRRKAAAPAAEQAA